MGRKIIGFVFICVIVFYSLFLLLKWSLGSVDVDYIEIAVKKIDKVECISNESMLNDHIASVDFDIRLIDGQEIDVGGVTYENQILAYNTIFTVNDYYLNYCVYDSEKQKIEVYTNSDFRKFFFLKNKSLVDFIDKICFQPRIETYLPVIIADDFVTKETLLENILEIWTETELKKEERKYFLRKAP